MPWKSFYKKTCKICSLYLPHIAATKQEIVQFINQLPKPFIIMGDLNARSAVWKDTGWNEKGRVTEEILLDTDVVLLNNGSVTHDHSQTNSYSVIDLTDCKVDFVHTVLKDLYDCDHYPIHVELPNNILSLKVNKFNIEKAHWTQ